MTSFKQTMQRKAFQYRQAAEALRSAGDKQGAIQMEATAICYDQASKRSDKAANRGD